MHTTTVRFAADTWDTLCRAAGASGVPRAQYIREATIARIATGLRGTDIVDLTERVELLEAQVKQLQSIAARRGRLS